MREALPQSVDPRRQAELGRTLSGVISLARMPRLAAVVLDAEQSAEDYAAFELGFRRDASGRHLVEGRVEATLRLRCERCNGELELPVSSNFTLAVVEGLDEAAQLPEAYEPLLPDETEVDPAALVEDELLLALPAVLRHPVGVCEPPVRSGVEDVPPADLPDGTPARDNPFAVLDALKRHH